MPESIDHTTYMCMHQDAIHVNGIGMNPNRIQATLASAYLNIRL